jgi:hypothetical protein
MVTTYGTELCVTRFVDLVHINPHSRKTGTTTDVKKPLIIKRRDDNIRRARIRIKRLVIQNFPHEPGAYQNPHFITLTYPDGAYAKIQNRDNHIKDLQGFMRELRHQVKTNRTVFPHSPAGEIKSLATLELTKKGNVHIHAVIFNLPFYRHKHDILNLWLKQSPSSSINNQQIDRVPWGRRSAKKEATKMARYLSKYLAKAFEENSMPNDKLYLPSKGLLQPETYRVPSEVSALFESAFMRVYRKSYISGEYYIPHLNTWAHCEIWEMT